MLQVTYGRPTRNGLRMRVTPLQARAQLSDVRFICGVAVGLLLALGFSAQVRGTTVDREAPWRRLDADLRLRIEPATRRPHLLRVELPAAYRQGIQGVFACMGDGRRIPASPVFFQGSLVGVECLSPWHRLKQETSSSEAAGESLPVEIYLLPQKEIAEPCPPDARTPVYLERTVRRLTTRPFTPTEMTRLTATLTRRLAGLDLAGFSATLPRDYWNSPAERTTAVLHWSTEMLLQADLDLQFGSDQAHVAWFVYIDGKPVADWRSSSASTDGAYFGLQRRFESGFRRVDFFAVQRVGEPMPVPMRKVAGKAAEILPSAELYSAHFPAAVAVERRDAVMQLGLRLDGFSRYIAAETEVDVLVFRVEELRSHLFGRGVVRRMLRVDGKDAGDSLGKPYAILGNVIPELSLSVTDELGYEVQVLYPSRSVWVLPTVVQPSLRIGRASSVLAAKQSLEVEVSVDVPEKMYSEVGGLLSLRWSQQDAHGNTLAGDAMPVPAPGKPVGIQMQLEPSAYRLELSCTVNDVPLVRSQRISVVRPSVPLRGLDARGEQLFLGNERAVLVCDSMPRLHGRVRAVATPADATEGRAVRLAIIDGFWAAAIGPDADVFPEDWLQRSGYAAVSRYAVSGADMDGAAREFRKFSVLGRWLPAADEEVVLWAVGMNELRAGLAPEELCLHLLFLCQAAAAAGKRSLLTTLPPVPGVDAGTSRKAALLTKELGERLGCPVVDAYSRVKNEHSDPGAFADLFCSYDGTIALSTPNNKGRIWLYRLLEEELANSALRQWR